MPDSVRPVLRGFTRLDELAVTMRAWHPFDWAKEVQVSIRLVLER